jgi:hypothetical protein
VNKEIETFLRSYNGTGLEVSNITYNQWNIFYTKVEKGKNITCRVSMANFQKWDRNNKLKYLINE